MPEFLLPRTDAGVVAQAVGAVVIFAAALGAAWRYPEARILVVGLGLTFFGFVGVRALH